MVWSGTIGGCLPQRHAVAPHVRLCVEFKEVETLRCVPLQRPLPPRLRLQSNRKIIILVKKLSFLQHLIKILELSVNIIQVELPASYVVDLRSLNLYTRLSENDSNPASILFKLFGKTEQNELERKYCMGAPRTINNNKFGIRSAFIKFCSTLT